MSIDLFLTSIDTVEESPAPSSAKKSTPQTIRIVKIAMEPVDGSHPDVVKLIKAGYTEK